MSVNSINNRKTASGSRQKWAKVGVRLRETPREFAFCAYTIMQRELFTIPDLAQDQRFAANPFVGRRE